MSSDRGQYLTQISNLIKKMIDLKVRIETEADQNLRGSFLNSANHILKELRQLETNSGAVSFLARLTGVDTSRTLRQQDLVKWHLWISEFRVEYETLSKESEVTENKKRFLANCRAIEEEVNRNWTKWVPEATIGVPSTEIYAYSHRIGDETPHSAVIADLHTRKHHRRGPGISVPGFQPLPDHFVRPAMSPFVTSADNRSSIASISTLPPGNLGYPAPNVQGESDGSHAQTAMSTSGNRAVDRRILPAEEFQHMLANLYSPPQGQDISGPPQAAHFPAGVPASQQGHYPQLSQAQITPHPQYYRAQQHGLPPPPQAHQVGGQYPWTTSQHGYGGQPSHQPVPSSQPYYPKYPTYEFGGSINSRSSTSEGEYEEESQYTEPRDKGKQRQY